MHAAYVQNSPVILPFSSTSMFSAAGFLGKPGMVIISPVRATRKPAPAFTFRFRTVMRKPRGAPEGFTVTVRELKVSAGAGFLVALTGDIMTMPGLPKVPAAEKIDVDENGRISGLF